jgi:hypothetical protein
VKKYSIVAVTLLFCCGIALTAHAQEEGKVVVTVPFEFIAGSKTLPAGTYTIGRLSLDTRSPLVISSRTNGSVVLPGAFDGTPADNSRLSFEHVGETYLLSEVATEIGTYTIVTGPAAASLSRLANMKSHDSMKSETSASGSQ